MQQNKPIFVVGSPRSGTSVLTWCLGQHSNIFVQEESNWIGRFAYQVELAYRVGTARGERSQLSALHVEREEFFGRFGATISRLILDHRVGSQAKRKAQLLENPDEPLPPDVSPFFRITRSPGDRKGRWVDGTPEYSFYILPLRLLFPEARFIHIVRDVNEVVRSMMHFQNTGGSRLVEDLRQAYNEWLTAARACHAAEKAYGADIVCRLRYPDLIARPKKELKRLLAFLSEEFQPSCLDPLQQRINSSQVPTEFQTDNSEVDPALVTEAEEFSAEMLRATERVPPDAGAAAQLEESFRGRADYLCQTVA